MPPGALLQSLPGPLKQVILGHGAGSWTGKLRADPAFKGRQFTAEVILWAVRWYLQFPISYRDLELMLQNRRRLKLAGPPHLGASRIHWRTLQHNPQP